MTFAGRPVFPGYFVDDGGDPAAGVVVTVYEADPEVPFASLDPETVADVLELATVYTDDSMDTPGDNPFVTADGNVWPFLAVGNYVFEANGGLLEATVSPDHRDLVTIDGGTP
jgi:hypothetical protein